MVSTNSLEYDTCGVQVLLDMVNAKGSWRFDKLMQHIVKGISSWGEMLSLSTFVRIESGGADKDGWVD